MPTNWRRRPQTSSCPMCADDHVAEEFRPIAGRPSLARCSVPWLTKAGAHSFRLMTEGYWSFGGRLEASAFQSSGARQPVQV